MLRELDVEYGDRLPQDIEARIVGLDTIPRPPEVSPGFDFASNRDVALQRCRPLASRLSTRALLAHPAFSLPSLLAAAAENEVAAGRTLRSVHIKTADGGPGGGIGCAPPELCAELIEAFADAVAREGAEPGLALAIFAYAYIISVHPLEDGNGRLARAVVDAVWAQHSGSRFPILLGPISKLFHGPLAQWLVVLMTRGGWAHFTARFATLIEAYCVAARAALAPSAQSEPIPCRRVA